MEGVIHALLQNSYFLILLVTKVLQITRGSV